MGCGDRLNIARPLTKDTLSIIIRRMNEKVLASREAIDSIGAVKLHEELSSRIDEPLTIYAVRQWRRRGVPGKWVPAVCAITDANPRDLNPLIPEKA